MLYTREAMCEGKIGYDSAPAAHKALRRFAKRRKVKRHRKPGANPRGKLEPYRCDCCGAWHLGVK